MGFEDRPYFREGQYRTPFDRMQSSTWIVRLIVINAVVFLLNFLPGFQINNVLMLDTGLFRTHFLVYELLTAGFVHLDVFHILFNMLVLYMLGRSVEVALGAVEFLWFYLVAIVVSNLIWLGIADLTTGSMMSIGGASGGVSAVVILFALKFPHQRIALWGVLQMPAWLLGVLVVGMDMAGAISRTSNIAYTAHLGGAAFAAVYHLGHWNFSHLSFTGMFSGLKRMNPSRPSLKVHRPDEDDHDPLAAQADRVLEKLHREGEESLSKKERRILESYSRKMRNKRMRGD